jgi:hypothetical protein
MSSIKLDVKYIIAIQSLHRAAGVAPAPVSSLSNVVGAVQKIKTAASTTSTAAPTLSTKTWPVTLWK